MAAYLHKPASPRWQPGRAPAGCRLYMPVTAGAGATLRDLCRANHGAFVGAPAWERGFYGPRLGGFSTANYVAIDPPAQLVGLVYPFWVAAHFVNADATFTAAAKQMLSQAVSANNNNRISLYIHRNATNQAGFEVRTASGTVSFSEGTAATADGLPHVLMGVARSASSFACYFDGRPLGTDTTAVGSLAGHARLSLGVRRGSSVGDVFPGSLIAVAMGEGAVPDPMALAADWLSGRFSAARPRSNLAILAAATTGTTTPTPGLALAGGGLLSSPLVR